MRVSQLISLDEMSSEDQSATTSNLITIFKDVGLNVIPVLSSHFRERLWGREASVSPAEIINAFSKAVAKYHDEMIAQLQANGKFTGVIKDYGRKLNIVFAIETPVGSQNSDKYQLYGITVMRKPPKQFIVRSGDVLVVEQSLPFDEKREVDQKTRTKNKFKWKSAKQQRKNLIKTLWTYANADAT